MTLTASQTFWGPIALSIVFRTLAYGFFGTLYGIMALMSGLLAWIWFLEPGMLTASEATMWLGAIAIIGAITVAFHGFAGSFPHPIRFWKMTSAKSFREKMIARSLQPEPLCPRCAKIVAEREKASNI